MILRLSCTYTGTGGKAKLPPGASALQAHITNRKVGKARATLNLMRSPRSE